MYPQLQEFLNQYGLYFNILSVYTTRKGVLVFDFDSLVASYYTEKPSFNCFKY